MGTNADIQSKSSEFWMPPASQIQVIVIITYNENMISKNII